MAKKQSTTPRINYGPDTALIMGEGQVARSEAAMDMAGGQAFAEGLGKSILAAMKEKQEEDAILDAAMVDLGGVQNINKLDQGYNKQAVTDFVRTQRDKYYELSKSYRKTKDPNILDQMEAIKFSFTNLNTQLDLLVGERKEYLDAYDKGQLVRLKGDNKYVMAYTNKGQFSVSENGDIGFTVDGEFNNFKDIAGKWNTKNNVSETYILEQNLRATELGEKGKAFYRDDVKNLYAANFESTGPEGIQVMAKTDLTGDNEYELPNGQKAGNMSFESMWSQGLLDEKFYKQIPKGTDSEWMYDRKNKDILKSMMSEYYTDVTEFSYNRGKANYKDPNSSKKSATPGHPSGIDNAVQLTNGQYMNVGTARTIKSNLETGTSFKWNGVDYKYADGKWQTPEGIIGDGTADDVVYNITNDQAFQGLKTEQKIFVDNQGETVDGAQEEFAEGNASTIPGLQNVINIDTLNVDDSAVAANLNSVMPTPGTNSNPMGYRFEVAKSTIPFTDIETPMGDFGNEAISLVDMNGDTVRYPEGHPLAGQRVAFITDNNQYTIKTIDDVLETFGLAGNMKTTSKPSTGGGKLLDN